MREGLQKIVPRDDTIVAIATPVGISGVGVVRVSGSNVKAIASRFLRVEGRLIPRRATVGSWVDESGLPIDEVVATLFEGPRSYTSEDVLEVSAHGNPVILRRIVDTVRASGARIATPGEFTLRAVANGKMDLIQAEGVRDFVAAQTEAQASLALRQLGGALSKRVAPVKDRLVDAIARMEAGIDFADDDVEPPSNQSLSSLLQPIVENLEELQRSYSRGRLIAQGLRLAIIGKPNVGKSSLFNRLLHEDRSIVADVPGTTRDVVGETTTLDGVPLRLSDTAGLRDATDRIERIGVDRSMEAYSDADLVIAVCDGSMDLDDDDKRVIDLAAKTNHVVVLNKSDLGARFSLGDFKPSVAVSVSAKTGAGFDELLNAIRDFLGSTRQNAECVLTSARQSDAVADSARAVHAAESALAANTPHEMVLLDLYEALTALNELTGEVVTEDILGRIFSTFCVGK